MLSQLKNMKAAISTMKINDVIDIIDVSKKTSDEDRYYYAEFLDGNLADVCLIKIYSGDYGGKPVDIKNRIT